MEIKMNNLLFQSNPILGNTLRLLIVYFTIILSANTTYASPPGLPKLADNNVISINDTQDDKEKKQSFGQWFQEALGLEEDDEEEIKNTQASNIPDKEETLQTIPEIPSFDQIDVAENASNINNNTTSNKLARMQEAPGKGETLLDQEFDITKDLDVNELFSEFADDSFEDTANKQDQQISKSQTDSTTPSTKQLPSLSNNTAATNNSKNLDILPKNKSTSALAKTIAKDDLQIPDFDKLLDQHNTKQNASIEPESDTIEQSASKDSDRKNLDDLPNIPDQTTKAYSASSNLPANREDDLLQEEELAYSQEDLSEEDKPFISELPQKENQKGKIASFRDQIKRKLSNTEELPRLSEKQLKKTNTEDDSRLSQELDNRQLRFVNNETQVLKLPNDDIVLGKLTEEARIEAMDFRSYVNLFWKNYEQIKDEGARESVESFLETYDENFNSEKFLHSDEEDYNALEVANKAIDYEKYDDLKVLLDNYSILQLDSIGGNNMLHNAAREGNYPAAKLLLMRGIDMKATNMRGESAMIIAKRYNHKHIEFLLRKAGFNQN